MVITFPTCHISISAMTIPLPIPCSNCHINQLRCNTTSHVKGSCVQCYVNGLECLFPPPTIPHQGVLSNGNSPFQRNCVPCSQRHRKCIFDNNHSSQCQRCIKFGLLCLFQLSSQGRRNDLCVETIVETTATAATEVSCLESKTRRASTSSMTAVNHTTAATDSLIAQPNHTAFGSTSSRKDDDDDKKGRLFDANESVHYFHHVDEDSCRGCINQSSLLNCS